MLNYLLLYVRSFLSPYIKSEKGQDLSEYALLVAVIAIVVILGATVFGNFLSDWFESLSSQLSLKLT